MSKSDSDSSIIAAVATCVFGYPFALVYMAYQTFAESYVMAQLWAWYAVPLRAPALGWHTFVGASLLWATFKLKPLAPQVEDTRSKEDKIAAFVAYVTAPWAILLIGWWFK